MHCLNGWLSRWFVYYPVKFLRFENLPYHIWQFKKSQWWSEEKIREYQFQKFRKLVYHAYHTVPFYQKRYREAGIEPDDIRTPEDIARLPFVTREDIMQYSREMRSTRRFPRLTVKITGGSTAQPIKIYKNPYSTCLEDAALWRSLSWYGIKPGDRQIRFWGIPGDEKALRKIRLIDFIMNRKRIPAREWNDAFLRQFIPMVLKFRPVYFYGYISLVQDFTRVLMQEGIDPKSLSLKAIVLTAEVPYPQGRKELQEIYRVPVVNEYGSSELGPIAYQCPQGNMHLMFENIFLEVVDDNGTLLPPGKTGELVLTDLNNYAMPLIRYRSRDFSAIRTDSGACGRHMPLIKEVTGRDVNRLRATDGRTIHASFALYLIEKLVEMGRSHIQFQIVQDRLDHVNLYVVRHPSLKTEDVDYFVEEIKRTMGQDMQVSVRYVDALQREPSGKFLMTKNLIQNK